MSFWNQLVTEFTTPAGWDALLLFLFITFSLLALPLVYRLGEKFTPPDGSGGKRVWTRTMTPGGPMVVARARTREDIQ